VCVLFRMVRENQRRISDTDKHANEELVHVKQASNETKRARLPIKPTICTSTIEKQT
jgi:hypothetical protein